jgi:transposase
MAFSDGSSIPLALYTESASPHEVALVEETLKSAFLKEMPQRLIGDKAYDSDRLDETLEEQGIEMIAPHRRNRKKKEIQDRRKLRRYKRRWKIERLFAWLQNFRRLVVRYECKAENFLGMAQLGCIVILLSESVYEMTSNVKRLGYSQETDDGGAGTRRVLQSDLEGDGRRASQDRAADLRRRDGNEHLVVCHPRLGAVRPEGLLVRASQPGRQHHRAF